MTRPNPHIAAMAPYALAKMSASPGKPLISLAQNESLRPPSPKATDAAAQVLAQSALYPDPDWSDLRTALAQLHGVGVERILCGAGSLDLIAALGRVYAGPDASILVPEHVYPFFRSVAQMVGARCDFAPEHEATVDVDALLAAVRPHTAMVCVANPGNPTGTRLPKTELLRLRALLRDDILLVIDEAYGEFADHLGERTWDMTDAGNCVVLRSFSKAYAMAGFRVGWGVFPDQILRELRKVMNPNNLSLASQAAACAAVADQTYMRATCRLTAELRDALRTELTTIGIRVGPSCTNFLLLRFDSADQAQAVDAYLQAQGIYLRRQGGAGLPDALRMTIGPEADCRAAVDALRHWKKAGNT